MEEQREISWRDYSVTLAILAINAVSYILCTQTGEMIYHIGSMNAEKILVDKQYYRLATAIFLHADIEHIVSNMIYLIGLGQMIEQIIGHVWFGILYLLSGLGAGVFSMLYSVLTGDSYDSVGASGAIFGLIGALFVLVVIRDMRRRAKGQLSGRYTMSTQNHVLYNNITMGKLIFVVVYMVYAGARAAGVDNAAHVGGLVCGLLIMAIMSIIKARRI